MLINFVTKSSGKKEPFNPEKLRKWSEFSAGKLNWSEIELEAIKQCYEGVSTRDLHNAMIAACINKKTQAYSDMAGRLLIGQIYKQAHNGFNSIPDLQTYYNEMVGKGLWAKMDYSEEEIKTLNKKINHKMNLTYGYSVLRQMVDKYLVKDSVKNVVHESPQFMFMGIAMKVMEIQPKERRIEDVLKFYKYTSELKINLPSPYLTTLRTEIKGSASCCFPAGTEVDMKGCKKFIEDISVGDEVVTSNGDIEKVTWTTNREYEGLLYNFRTVTTVKDKTWATKDHKYLVKRGENDVWVEAQDVMVGDWLKTSDVKSKDAVLMLSDFMKDELKEAGYTKDGENLVYVTWEGKESTLYPKIKDFNLNCEEFGKILGYYAAEGCVIKDKRREKSYMTRFTFGLNSELYIKDVTNFLDHIGVNYSVIDTTEKDKCKTVSSTFRILGQLFIKLLGKKAENKGDKTQFIRDSSEEFKLGFLTGFLRGDGCAHKTGYTVSSISKDLLYTVRDVSQALGHHGSLNKRIFKSEMYNNAKEQYTLNIYANPNDNLVKAVNKNSHKIEEKNPENVKFVKHCNGSLYVKVKSIDTKQFKGIVYDFEVEHAHNFCVEGVVVHNCLFRADDNAESLAIANYLAHEFTLNNAGIGVYLQTRATGKGVKKNRIIHGGLLPYYRWMQSSVAASKQSSRGGSATVTYTCLEPDWDDLIRLKNPLTPVGKKVDMLDYSIVLNNAFLKRVAKNEDWMLVSFDDAPELYEALYKPIDEFEEIYDKVSRKKIKKTFIKAREMLVEIIKQRAETGRIYIFFADNANKHTPFNDTIYQSNLC